LLIDFIASYFPAATFLNDADHSSNTNRLFLTVAPALAFGILLFETCSANSQMA
jgi:hypothetical protein